MIKHHLKNIYKKYGLVTILLFVLVFLYYIALIIVSIHRPLWNDEATRADIINLNFHLSASTSKYNAFEPIPLTTYLFDKFLAIFANTNFIYRVTSYIGLLALPIVSYRFLYRLLNKATADLMIPITAITAYIIEFSTQDKPYILDIVCVLLFVLAYLRYEENKLKLKYFIPISIILLLSSFASFFALPVIGLLFLKDYFKKPNKKQLRALLIWAGIILGSTLVYYFFFLRTQVDLNRGLASIWDDYMYKGSFVEFLKSNFDNVATYFNLQPTVAYRFLGIYSGWSLNQSLHLIDPIIGLPGFLSYSYLGLSVLGIWFMFKNKKYTYLICLFGLLATEWFAALLHLWPFGEARTNLFSTYLITAVPFYAIVLLVIKTKGLYRYTLLAVFSVIAILTFPYQLVSGALTNSSSFVSNITYSYMGYSDQKFAKIISQSSKPNDLVLIDFYSNPSGLQYYYQFSSYDKSYKNRTSNTDYLSNIDNDLSVPEQLHGPKDKFPKTIWLIYAPNYGITKVPSVIKENYSLNYSNTNYTQVLLKYKLN